MEMYILKSILDEITKSDSHEWQGRGKHGHFGNGKKYQKNDKKKSIVYSDEIDKEQLISDLVNESYDYVDGVFVSKEKVKDIYTEGTDAKKEFDMCKILNENGHDVYLLPEHYSWDKHPDTLFINRDTWKTDFLELKNVSSQNPIVTGKRFYEGKKQSSNVFVRVKNSDKILETLFSIEYKIKNFLDKGEIPTEGMLVLYFDKLHTYMEFEIKKDGLKINPSTVKPKLLQYKTADHLDKSIISHSVTKSIRNLNIGGDNMNDPKFKYFQEKVISILDSLEKQENSEKKEVKKSLLEAEEMAKGGKGLPVGTVREWKGKKYVKIAPNQWKRKYDKEERGIKIAISALKKKAAACTTSQELLQLVLQNRDRFSDGSGYPLPIVQELSEYVSKRNDEIESGAKKETAEKPAEKNTAKVGENLKLGEIVYFKPPYEPEIKLKVVGVNEEGVIVLENVKTKETERISEGLLYRESGNEEGSLVLPKNYATEKEEELKDEKGKREKEVGDIIDRYMKKYAEDWYTKSVAEDTIKRYGQKRLETIAKNEIKSDADYIESLKQKIADVEKRDGEELAETTISSAIWNHQVNKIARELAIKKLQSMEKNATDDAMDIPVDEKDMKEAINIIGADVKRILEGRDTYGNAKQTLTDKIKRRVRNSPGVARAMLMYIKQEQERTGKKVYTDKHSIWDELPKLNENARNAKDKGESESKAGVSGNLYEGKDGTTIVENKDWGRYQISFPGKPDGSTISMLKRNGFRWSPSTKTWVCFNTANGERSMKAVAEQLGLSKPDEGVNKSISDLVMRSLTNFLIEDALDA